MNKILFNLSKFLFVQAEFSLIIRSFDFFGLLFVCHVLNKWSETDWNERGFSFCFGLGFLFFLEVDFLFLFVVNPLAIVTAISFAWLILNYMVRTLIREMQSSLTKPFNSKPSLIKIIYRWNHFFTIPL